MAKFQIVFHEIQSYVVPVEADTLEAAQAKANEAFILSVDEYFDCQVSYKIFTSVEVDDAGNIIKETPFQEDSADG